MILQLVLCVSKQMLRDIEAAYVVFGKCIPDRGNVINVLRLRSKEINLVHNTDPIRIYVYNVYLYMPLPDANDILNVVEHPGTRPS